MARTKRPTVRDPTDFPPSLRRSRRNQPQNPPSPPPKSPTPPPKSPTPPPKSPTPPAKSPTPPPNSSPSLPLKPQSSQLEDSIPETVGSSSIIEEPVITVEAEPKTQKERQLTEAWAIVPYSPKSQHTKGNLDFDMNIEAEADDSTHTRNEPEKLFEEGPKNDIPDLNVLFDMPPSENPSFDTPNEDSPTVGESSTSRKRGSNAHDSESDLRQKKKRKGKGKSKKSLTRGMRGLAAALAEKQETSKEGQTDSPYPNRNHLTACPRSLHKLWEGVPSYKEDVMVKETGGKWQIELKAVARLRDRKGRATQNEVPGMLQNLLAQNSSLMDSMLQQRSEFLEKLESIRGEMKEKVKKEWKKKKVGLVKKHKKEVKRMKKEKAELEEEVLFLKKILESVVPDAVASLQHDQQQDQ
ncbi:hypothetical protein L6452_34510 [Arctium lappa]|uniref:Uncharacterized protein n=1 Tax=Arctium lappa TaxID=4217 RepID=A0ACB8YMN4_ARCLA|nr:hypothetical protein L6452_34510 [Arctium lappa]